ncbi:lambda-exonuclease family protein [Candidatus Phytoplasma melaleucae]|uniref:YqaJ viral recombinase family protein n=1 Tax=Candidatus Phytoplasma melaleucae TaxID=2982630 RepID=A0ABT9DD62_9MOLU|nr:YqaJ viral recombinase family protein ['Melaleuca sp.' phytoplasma]MDO8168031.1 YqaJ viral recombinase family protein ['Melaleuca sp.' phytoplasma]MDV3205312.1 YqaJ viral recombinase family protein [Weeping tea tree witches'-broom phytoplasma]
MHFAKLESNKFLNLKQNSEAWHKHRSNYINASEVAAIMGLNPFESRKLLFKRKLFQEKIEDNIAMRHGRKLEPEARNFFNEVYKVNFIPIVFTKYFMSASLDGWHRESKSVLEIKCPISCNTNSWSNFFINDKVPVFYYAQVQAQLYCSDSEKAFFLVYQTYQNVKVKEIKKDSLFIEKMCLECYSFYKLFNEAKLILNRLNNSNK